MSNQMLYLGISQYRLIYLDPEISEKISDSLPNRKIFKQKRELAVNQRGQGRGYIIYILVKLETFLLLRKV